MTHRLDYGPAGAQNASTQERDAGERKKEHREGNRGCMGKEGCKSAPAEDGRRWMASARAQACGLQ